MSHVSFVFFVALVVANCAAGQTPVIRVSQASEPGATDFDNNVLNVLRPWTSTAKLRPGEVYDYRNSHWNGTVLDEVGGVIAERSHVFIAQTAAPMSGCAQAGWSLFWVHDKPGNADGGNAQTVVTVRGISSDVCRNIRDDNEDDYSNQGAFPA